MKPRPTFRSFLILAGSSLLAISSAHAGNTWDGGGGSGFWNNSTNWNVDGLPGTGALTFVNDVQNSTNNDLAAALTYGGILFTNDGSAGKTNAFTLAGNSITLGGNITTTANTAGSTITDVISLDLILNATPRTITTNQLSGTVQHNLTISGIISETGGARGITKAGAGVLTLSNQNTYTGTTTVNAGTLRAGAAAGGQAFGLSSTLSLANAAGVTLDLNDFNQTVGSLGGGGATGGTISLGSATLTIGTNNTSTSYGGTITGSGGLIKAGSGTQTFTINNNTYQGGTRIDGGLLLVNADTSLGDAAGSITLNGGGLAIGASLASNRELILNNVAGNLVRVQGNQTWTNTGNITGDGGVIFRQNPSGGVTADLQGTANTFKGSLGIEFGGSGMTVKIRSLADSATANGNIIYGIGSSANTGGNGQIFEWASAAAAGLTLDNRKIEFAQNGSAWGTIKNSHAANAITINTNLVVSGTGTKTLVLEAVDGPRNAFNGNITDGSGTVVLRKEGAGDWVLGGSNSYTGGSAITAGGLTFLQTGSKSGSGTHAFSGNTMLGLGVNGASGFTSTDIVNAFAGGTLTGNLAGITVATSTNVGVDTTNGDFNLASGITTGGKQLHKLGDNTLTLSGTNTFTGAAIAKQGTLQFATTASLPSSTAARLVARSGATLAFNVGGVGEFTAGNITTILGNQTASTGISNGMNAGSRLGFDTTNASGTFTIGDVIADTTGASGGARGVTKLGTGSLGLTNTSSYTGNTIVSKGTLIVNGNISTSLLTTVQSGATLKGQGTVGALTINGGGTLASGTSIESLATGNLTLLANAIFEQEINKDVLPGVSGDLTAVTGTMNLALTNNSILNLIELGSSGSWIAGDKITLISYSGTWNGGLFKYLGNVLNDGSTFNFSGITWEFDYNNTLAGDNFTADLTSPNYVTMTAVPEPRAALLGGIGMLLLIRRRRA